MVLEALCYQHMEEVEEKGGCAEVEVTMWVSNQHMEKLKSRCLKGTSGLLHSMSEVFGTV